MNEEGKLLLTVGEAASRLGLGRSHLYKLIMDGQIRSIRVGRSRRVPVASLADFVKQRLEAERGG